MGPAEAGPTSIMNADREQIFARVRDALAPLPQRAALPEWERDLVRLRQTQSNTASDEPTALWDRFARRLQSVNGIAFTAAADLVLFLDKNGWRRGYCDPALWPQLQAAFVSPEFRVETTFDRTHVDGYDFGITRASGAIAETGTLILTDRDTPNRLAALAPWVHIAVIADTNIFPDIPAALAALPPDPNVIWVTGPSKTADVEGILIEGVHGPGAQIALRAGA